MPAPPPSGTAPQLQRGQELATSSTCRPLSPAPKFSLPHARSTSVINLVPRVHSWGDPPRRGEGRSKCTLGIHGPCSLAAPPPCACKHFYLTDGCLAPAGASCEHQIAEETASTRTEGRAQKPSSADPKPGHRHPRETGSLYPQNQIRNLN